MSWHWLGVLVDLSSHNTNPPGAFDGSPCELPDTSGGSDDEAVIAITSFVEEFDVLPTAKLWTAAGMAPTERTVRRYFGSFRSALDRAGLL